MDGQERDAAGGADRLPLAAVPAVAGWRRRLRGLLAAGRTLTPHQWHVLGVLGAANLIDSYDVAILGLALPQIQVGLGIAEAEVGGVTATIRLGVIFALVLTVLADRFGRRGILLVTIVGFTLCTFLTSFARTAGEFAFLQFLARVFIAGESMLAVVVIAEEFGADVRGWGIGMLAAMGTLGHGLASVVFALVNVLPFGWRALYVIGIVPLLLLAWFRRSLGETQRFTRYRAGDSERGWRGALRPVRHMLQMYPGRLLALSAAVFPMGFVLETSLIFVSKSLQQEHGYAPGQVAMLYLSFGVLAPVGNVLAGGLGDRFGRKRTMIVGLLLNAALIAVFYNTDGAWIPPVFGLMLLTLTMVLVLFAALGSELFPTSYRSTASGVRAVVSTLGAAAGLSLEGFLYERLGSHAAAITAMLAVTPVAPLIIGFCVPETARLELEEIAPEIELEGSCQAGRGPIE
ncbi:MFS transporter [Candidatus Binatia bacterium]|nr:MFS transporter [Candidatus Binatia bacterium]